MNFKVLVLIFAVQVFAANLVFAQNEPVPADINAEIRFEGETVVSPQSEPAPEAAVDVCATTLPELESEYADVDRKSRLSDKISAQTYRGYVSSFNDMTKVLFDLAQIKREEMARIDEAEQSLRAALATFNDKKDSKNSKELQDQYMNLTVKLYSSAMDSQKTVDQIKKSLAQVETARAQHDALKQDPIDLENKKLELEGKIISLKIRCRN